MSRPYTNDNTDRSPERPNVSNAWGAQTMPTIRTLLDRYGQPPPEVACDWAWQIRDCLDNRAAATDEPTHTCLLEERAWTDLEVSETGELVCGQLDSRTAQAALADLRQWSGGSYDCPTAAGDLTRPLGTAWMRSQSARSFAVDASQPRGSARAGPLFGVGSA